MAVLLCAGSALAQGVLHVAPQAPAKAAGTPEQPVSLQDALDLAAADPAVREIILAGGEYQGQFRLGAAKDAKPEDLPRLAIRAAEGQTPVLSHSLRVDRAEPVPGFPGLFRTAAAHGFEPHMWERDTRVRYAALSNKASVAALPGSCFVDPEEKSVYFSTSDGRPPDQHEVGLALSRTNSRAFAVYRHNTTIEGLHFRDYLGHNVPAFQTYGDNVAIRGCHFDNCHQAWVVWTGSRGAVMEDCSGVDVAQPVYSFADGVTVRRCRFEKARDRFMLPIYPQNDTAYQVYSPGRGGTFEFNFCKGYANGIWVKAGAGRYVIRHNTVVDSHYGICWVTSNADSDTSWNVIVAADEFIRIDRFHPTYTQDGNLFWLPKQWQAFAERLDVVRGANRGRRCMLADPRFVDPENGDYRLLPDSPALFLKDEQGLPAGAFGVADPADAAKARPALSLAFGADTRRIGRSGELTFERDPWIGGGVTRIRDLEVEGEPPRRLTGEDAATVQVRAFDATGRIVKTRLTLGGQEPQESDYQPELSVKPPAQDGDYAVRIEVQNDRGTWSRPAEFVLRLDRRPPAITGAPQVLANDHGLVVAVRANEPCFASVEYGPTPQYGGLVQTPKLVKRFWDANDGGEWVQTWTIPAAEHALPILAPAVKTGDTVHLRITLEDEAGLKTTTEDMTAVVRGPARSVFVATTGEDAPGRGSREQPVRTLQYAVDRALPGDRVVLLPGVYTQLTTLNHGGTAEDARITIEAEQPGAVTLDSAKRENALIHLEGAAYVTIRDLRILYFKKAGVYAYRSPHTRVESCVFFNGTGWETGYHAFFFWSPHCTVTRSLASGAEIGFYFLESPHATVTHNTCSQHMYGATSFSYSVQGSVQTNNSFAFAGNSIYGVLARHPEELKSFRSDYNNLGTNVTAYNADVEKTDPELWRKMKAEEFQPKYDRSRFRTGSKGVAMLDRYYLTLRAWREKTGWEAHSVFADPCYASPYPPIDRWDWRVRPESPNVGRGEGGATIGAFGKAE